MSELVANLLKVLFDMFCILVVAILSFFFKSTDYLKVCKYTDLLDLKELSYYKYENTYFMNDEDVYKVYLEQDSINKLRNEIETSKSWIRLSNLDNNNNNMIKPYYVSNKEFDGFVCLYDMEKKQFVDNIEEKINDPPYYYYLIDFDENVLYFCHQME